MKVNGNDISRRKILGSLGAIGGAAALGGASTMAFFSDEETLANNQLVAGELDLKIDWEEHYSDWSDDESAGGVDFTMSQPETPSDYYAFPVGADDPDLYVNRTDDTGDGRSSLERFMDNTSIEAYPDSNDNGIQDDFNEDNVCSDDLLADTPEDLDPNSSDRTLNTPATSARGEATVDKDGNPLPLVNIGDIKPGDFGEVTFSFHLCDNPGYVWLQGQPVRAAENDWSEPERKDTDESGSADESYNVNDGDDPSDILNSDVELLDTIQTAWWYDDNCNNLIDGSGSGDSGTDPVDIAFLLDRSGSMSDETDALQKNIQQVANGIAADARYAVVPYEETTTTNVTDAIRNDTGTDTCKTFIDTGLTSDSGDLLFDYVTCGGSEKASEAIQFALDELSWRSEAQKVVVVLTDEDDSDSTEQQRADAMDQLNAEDACLLAVADTENGDDDLRTMATGTVSFSSSSGLADRSVNCGDWIEITDTDGLSDAVLNGISDFITTVARSGEPVFFQGSLREALSTLTAGNGVPLAGNIPAADGGGADGSCFSAGDTHCIGFSWWLPVDHANEIQTDSVGFDVGFYTEQCRHNDGGEAFGNAR
jgi:predicted ribosomally synthesized peptide with SipW-like signal peptide